MAYTAVEGLPGAIRNNRSTWSITSDGSDSSTLTIDLWAKTNFLGTSISPVLKAMLSRGNRQMIDSLCGYVVTGRPSQAKQKAAAKRPKR